VLQHKTPLRAVRHCQVKCEYKRSCLQIPRILLLEIMEELRVLYCSGVINKEQLLPDAE